MEHRQLNAFNIEWRNKKYFLLRNCAGVNWSKVDNEPTAIKNDAIIMKRGIKKWEGF